MQLLPSISSGLKTCIQPPKRGNRGILSHRRRDETSSDFHQGLHACEGVLPVLKPDSTEVLERQQDCTRSDFQQGVLPLPQIDDKPGTAGASNLRGHITILEQELAQFCRSDDTESASSDPKGERANSQMVPPLQRVDGGPSNLGKGLIEHELVRLGFRHPRGVASTDPISLDVRRRLDHSDLQRSYGKLWLSALSLSQSASRSAESDKPNIHQANNATALKSATGVVGASRIQQKERRRQMDMCEVQRKVFGGVGSQPGYWDADAFCTSRQEFLDEGRFESIAALTSMAVQASNAALDAGEYRLTSPEASHVQIPHGGHVRFYGLDTIDATSSTMGAPPIICSPMRTLDAAMEMVKMYPSHVVAATFDATDFSKDGKRLSGAQQAQSAAQQELFIRTNLEYHCRTAQIMCREGRVREQLTDTKDPLILAASEVSIFRGAIEDGYPFLSHEDAGVIDLLITGRQRIRPLMSARGEYFAMQDDYTCLIDRLNLIACGAIAQSIQRLRANKETKTADNQKPVLVIGLQDLTVAASQQPRHSIAMALKGWRLHWARVFEAVLVACGDNETADRKSVV